MDAAAHVRVNHASGHDPLNYPRAYASPMQRVSLTPDQVRRAVTTGALAHVIFAVGVWLGFSAALLLLSAAISSPDQRESIAQEGYGIDAATAVLLLVVGLVAGLALVASAIVLSGRLLASAQLRAPWAVTWSALAISAAIDFVLSGVFTFVSYALSFQSDTLDPTTVTVVGTIVMLAVVALVGAVFWRLMASAFRGYVVEPTPTFI